jgi:hypothetical protein
MDIILDSPATLVGDVVRCSACGAYLNMGKCKTCPRCDSPICYKCGHCHCDLSKERKLKIWSENGMPGDITWDLSTN